MAVYKKGDFMEYMFGDKKHEKIKLCETDDMKLLVKWIQALNKNDIPYETKLKKRTIINNLFFLIFYHAFSSGIDHKNEVTCIYVCEENFDSAKKAIVDCIERQ